MKGEVKLDIVTIAAYSIVCSFLVAGVGIALILHSDSTNTKRIKEMIEGKAKALATQENKMTEAFSLIEAWNAAQKNLVLRCDSIETTAIERRRQVEVLAKELGRVIDRCSTTDQDLLQKAQQLETLAARDEQICKSIYLDIDILKQRQKDLEPKETTPIEIIYIDGGKLEKPKAPKAPKNSKRKPEGVDQKMKDIARQVGKF